MTGDNKVGVGITSYLAFLVAVPWIAGSVFIANYGPVTGNIIRYSILALILAIGAIGYKYKGMDFFRILGEWIDGFGDEGKSGNTKPKKQKARRPPGHWTSKLIVAVGDQCEFPRCRKTRHLEVHHIDPFAGGGSNRLNNLIVVCPEHHKDFGSGAMNKTRQREYVRRESRFSDPTFPQQWKRRVLDQEKAKVEQTESALGW